ncbi:MAG: nicotinate-nucleotide diphosphorylase (carboxylating), partial [Fidelibacterota bacterium]
NDLADHKKVLTERIDRIMMDNMDVEDVKRGIEMVRRRAEVEISGGITLKNVRDYAETGADYISVGALTHSSRFLDLTLIFR